MGEHDEGLSELRRKESRRKRYYIFDPQTDLSTALNEDVRAAAKVFEGVHEAIARRLGMKEMSVYKRLERPDQRWTLKELGAVVQVTGGSHFRACLDGLAAGGLVNDSDHQAVARMAAEVVEMGSAISRQAIEDLAGDDDTPGRYDRGERDRLLALVHEEMARLQGLESQLKSLKCEG